MKLTTIRLPKVKSIGNGRLCFQETATLQDVAVCMEVSAANWCGLENGGYCVGSQISFHRLPSGETLCGRVGVHASNVFSIEAILLADERTLLEEFLGYERNPEFEELLSSYGLSREIKLGADE